MTQIWTQLKNSEPDLYSVVSSKFNHVLSDNVVAGQIAMLLNMNNNLNKHHNVNSIITNQVKYFITINNQMISGCVGLLKESRMDKILHLSVNVTSRNLGVGKCLLNTAINNSDKNIIYMCIREDNIASINLALSTGFKIIAYRPKYNYNIFTLCLFRR